MLGQGGFSAAVAAENRHKAALLHRQIQVLKYGDAGHVVHARISKRQMFRFDDFAHTNPPHQGVQRPVEPQGSIRPEAFTGRPSSPTAVEPP